MVPQGLFQIKNDLASCSCDKPGWCFLSSDAASWPTPRPNACICGQCRYCINRATTYRDDEFD